MGRRLLWLAAACAAATTLGAGTASAAPYTVCASGCAFTTIQAAIDAATPGDTITIGPGAYVENVVVDKSVTLQGAGDLTVVYPAVSAPDPCSGSSLCGSATAASNIVLVRANDVTISSLRLEGDNPNLTSGVVAGGADIDARNGVIADYYAGTWNGLTVSDVTVSDVYLRGIYASSGGTFDFEHDTVDNVQADPASIAMFNFGGSGVMADNVVTRANDALSANWSTGTQFLGNDVGESLSGVHTDNSGGHDVIRGNHVHDCGADGHGIWVFVPYGSTTVDDNRVEGCYVGLGLYGGAGGSATFSDNDVRRDGAATTDPSGTYGAYVTTDQLGYGAGDATATFTGNYFAQFTTGLYVTEASGADAAVTAHGNSFHGNDTGASGAAGTTVDAEGNWWGCKNGPADAKCDSVVGTVDSANWLTKKP